MRIDFKHNPYIENLLKNSAICVKCRIYFAYLSYPDGYDPDEGNITATKNNLNPITIKGYAVDISGTKVVYRGIGKGIEQAIDFYCESRYKKYFEQANKIEVAGNEYEVYKDGSSLYIQSRPFNLIRVSLKRKM